MHASPLTTHVLDTSRGKPAVGVGVTLEKHHDTWTKLEAAVTNADGRAAFLAGQTLEAGDYRLTFAVGAYQSGFYPEVAVCFSVADPAQHYHVPLLLSPFGYSTYRGS